MGAHIKYGKGEINIAWSEKATTQGGLQEKSEDTIVVLTDSKDPSDLDSIIRRCPKVFEKSLNG